MGFFNNARLRLSAMFNGAPAAEVDRVNAALKDVAITELAKQQEAPQFQYRPNRADRRAASKSRKQRDRNTDFGNRSQHLTPKQQHKGANDKGYQFALHPLLWGLLNRGGYNRAVEGGAA